MSLNFQIKRESAFILVAGDGEFDLADSKRIIETAIDSALEQKVPRILIDARSVTGKPTTMQRFEFANHVVTLYRQRERARFIRIAVVGFKPLIDPNRFGETVAVNRGVPLRVTTNITEAIEWLAAKGAE